MTKSEAESIEECWRGQIRGFNYDWFVLAEYVAAAPLLFTNREEAINHANESEPTSANTLVFIST